MVIAGKGHETYQIIAGQVLPFDDRVVAREALAGRARRPRGGAACRLTLAELVRGTQGALVGGRLDTVVTGVSIDSRTCRAGDAFFAIRGAHQDGHAFVGHAPDAGRGLRGDGPHPAGLGAEADFPVVLVDDTTVALQRLGAAHRRRVHHPGRRDHRLQREDDDEGAGRRRCCRPAGACSSRQASYNNQWGVPLTLLALEPEHEAAVLELGMNAFGEIAALAQLCQPTIGVVTTIGPAHLEGVGSIEGVQKAKGELVEAIPPDGCRRAERRRPAGAGPRCPARGRR